MQSRQSDMGMDIHSHATVPALHEFACTTKGMMSLPAKDLTPLDVRQGSFCFDSRGVMQGFPRLEATADAVQGHRKIQQINLTLSSLSLHHSDEEWQHEGHSAISPVLGT